MNMRAPLWTFLAFWIGGVVLLTLSACDGTTTSSDDVQLTADDALPAAGGAFAPVDSSSPATFAGGPPGARGSACESASAGSTCSFENRNGETVSGTCEARPDGSGRLVCRSGDGPPEQALAACSGIAVGASCSFSGFEGQSVSGTCTARPDNSGQVVCRPDDRPDRGELREASRNACADSSEGGSCSFEAPFGTVSGTCAMPPDGDELVCRPERD